MKTKLVLVAALLLGCGAEPEDADLGTLEQDLTAKLFHAWSWEDGWDHHRCDMDNGSSACVFPPRYQIDYAGLGGQSLWYTGAVGAEGIFESASSFRFFPTSCAGGGQSCLELVFDAETIPGSSCGPSVQVRDVMHVACVSWTQLSESYAASAYFCQQTHVGVDFAKLEAWFTCRGLSTAQKANTRKQLMAHALGAAAGLGATDAGNTPMSLTVTALAPQHTLQAFETQMLSTYNPTSPGFTVVP